MLTGSYVLFLVMLSHVKGVTAVCKSNSISSAIQGHACETQEFISIPAVENHHPWRAFVLKTAMLQFMTAATPFAHCYHNLVCYWGPGQTMCTSRLYNHVSNGFLHVLNALRITGWSSTATCRLILHECTTTVTCWLVNWQTNSMPLLDGQTKASEWYNEELVVDGSCSVNWVWFNVN